MLEEDKEEKREELPMKQRDEGDEEDLQIEFDLN